MLSFLNKSKSKTDEVHEPFYKDEYAVYNSIDDEEYTSYADVIIQLAEHADIIHPPYAFTGTAGISALVYQLIENGNPVTEILVAESYTHTDITAEQTKVVQRAALELAYAFKDEKRNLWDFLDLYGLNANGLRFRMLDGREITVNYDYAASPRV